MKLASEACQLSASPPPLPPPPLPPLTVLPPPTADAELEEVLAELEKLQNPRKSWASGLVIFGLSLILFASVGAWQWDASLLLLLLGVLFIHELGHFVAMKAFRYQNLKMFFIPFFGAAVSGVQLRAEGWKKAVVSLMGPMPGVFLGAALTIVGLLTSNATLASVALGFLLINGFNLLPVLPLDGGWLLNAVLFCRNKWVEAGFKVLASLGLLGLSILLQDWLFMFLGIWMLLTVPHTFRVSKIAEQLDGNACPLDPAGQQQISRDSALAILEGVKVNMSSKTALKPKTLAQIVMTVYEKRHTATPGLWTSMGLLAAYLGTILVMLLFTGLATLHRFEMKASQDPAFRQQYEAALANRAAAAPADTTYVEAE